MEVTMNRRLEATFGGAALLAALVLPMGLGAQRVHAAVTGTWVQQSPATVGTNLGGVDMASATEGWAVGEAGVILRTADGGITWSEQVSGTTEPLNAVRFLDPLTGWAVGNVMLYTTDGGGSWHQGNSFPATNYGVDFIDAQSGWAVGIGGVVYTTTDGGHNWSGKVTPTSDNLKDVDFVDASSGWAVGGNGAIIRTTNGGATWTVQSSGTTAFLDGVSFVSATEGWAAGGNVFLYTTNGGSKWTQQSVPAGTWVYSLT